ncbi:MAG: hypothetical protein RLZZ558_1894 [Planctomycetota bacterium]|jgi:3'(2'), 5'-bisphosphate nucleotidase
MTRQVEISESELAGRLADIAKAAGEAILAIYERGAEAAQIKRKADDSPLTAADLAAHRVIVTALAAWTPTIPVVSEEDEASLAHRTGSGTFWLIDPLDGTREFIARNGEFTVNIALVRQGVAVAGVVHAPALGECFVGIAGSGSTVERGGAQAPVRVASDIVAPLRVVASKSHMNEATQAFIERLGPCTLVQAGSSLKFCRVAEGAAHCYPRLGPTCEWDTAAAQAVVEAAGGLVCTLDGRPLRYGKPDVRNPEFVACAAPLDRLIR